MDGIDLETITVRYSMKYERLSLHSLHTIFLTESLVSSKHILWHIEVE